MSVHELRADRVQKRYGGRTVVRDVSILVRGGEVVGLLGPNGAGKTTTFYMCVGLVAPDGGSITLDGQEITEEPMYRRAQLGLGYLPQEASIFRKLTVRDNIMAILETVPMDESKRRQRLDELLTELGVAHVASSVASALSGGERRRVEIARALARAPHFILLDEPFAGIDPLAIKDIQGIISTLRKKGIGVLVTDHNVRETLGICDRAYILIDGKILEEGTPREIASSEDARRYYLGGDFRLPDAP